MACVPRENKHNLTVRDVSGSLERALFLIWPSNITKHYHDNGRWRPRGDETTHRLVRVRFQIVRRARPCRRSLQHIGRYQGATAGIVIKGTVARFVDKGRDSGEVTRLVERNLRDARDRVISWLDFVRWVRFCQQFREAIAHYQLGGNRLTGPRVSTTITSDLLLG